MHINQWKDEDYKNFEIFVESNYKKIVNLDYILKISHPNISQSIINYFVEKSLKFIRLFK